jgi:RimJ/RimL family protein N-acetyltransferase
MLILSRVQEVEMVTLVWANENDVPFVMATERHEGYERVVGRWTEARHRTALGDGSHAYFLAVDGSEPIGFAILREWDSVDRVTLIKRIAVRDAGQGRGSAFLSLLIEKVFNETVAHRLWLSVFPENKRAIRAYEKSGFIAEGVARGSAYFGGTYRDELIMAILRSDRA